MKKYLPIFIFIAFLMTACNHLSNPTTVFSQIQKKILSTTNQKIQWNKDKDIFKEISEKTLKKQPLTLERAIEIAMLNNPLLQAEYEKIGIACADYRQASLLNNPVLEFSYQFGTKKGQGNVVDPLQVMQNILEIFLIPLKREAAKNEIESLKNSILNKVTNIIEQTRLAYYELQTQLAILENKKKILLAKELMYDAAKLMANEGNNTQLFLAEKKQIYELCKIEVHNNEIALIAAKETLNNLLGIFNEDTSWNFSKEFEILSDDLGDLNSVIVNAIANNYELKELFYELKADAANLSIDTNKLLFNDFSLGISSQTEDDSWLVGPQGSIAIPIFDLGFASRSRAHAEILHKYKLLVAKAIFFRNETIKTYNTYLEIKNQIEVINKEVIPNAETLLTQTKKQHNAMQVGVFALLEAKINQLDQQVLLLQKNNDFYKESIYLVAIKEGKVFIERGGNEFQ